MHGDRFHQAPHPGIVDCPGIRVLDCAVVIVHDRKPHHMCDTIDLDAASNLAAVVRVDHIIVQLVCRALGVLLNVLPGIRPGQIIKAALAFLVIVDVDL